MDTQFWASELQPGCTQGVDLATLESCKLSMLMPAESRVCQIKSEVDKDFLSSSHDCILVDLFSDSVLRTLISKPYFSLTATMIGLDQLWCFLLRRTSGNLPETSLAHIDPVSSSIINLQEILSISLLEGFWGCEHREA